MRGGLILRRLVRAAVSAPAGSTPTARFMNGTTSMGPSSVTTLGATIQGNLTPLPENE